MKNRFKLICASNTFFLIIFFGFTTNAQLSPKAQRQLLDSLLFAFPNDDVIVLDNKTEIRAFMEKKKPNYKKTESETYMILRESGIDKLKNIEIPLYADDKIDRSECYSVDINGRRNAPRFLGISDRISESFVFYDGGKIAKFEYSNLGVGSIVSYSIVVNTTFIELPAIHVVSDYRPCLKSEISITSDDNINYDLLSFNTDSVTITKNSTDLGSRNQTTWSFSKIGTYENESSDEDALHVLPHLYFLIRSYNVDGAEISVNGDLNQLTNWYNQNVQDVVNAPLSEDLIKLAKDITAPYALNKDKLKAIYYWVQENVRYIAFEAGRDGFVPRNPSDVLAKRYGDCKDMSSIIYGLSKAVGISTNLTWVGTRSLPYSYQEHPFTFTDNHMIATYNDGDSIYVLDATSSFQPWGVPTSMIQTKSILVRDSSATFKIYDIPAYQPNLQSIIDTTFLRLKGTTLIANSTTYFNGYSKLDLHYAMQTQESEKAMALLNLLNRSNNNISAKITNTRNINNRDSAAVVDYEFSISKYAISAGNKTYLNLFLDSQELIFFDPKKRKNSYELDYLQSNEHTILFSLPENASAKDLPAPFTFENDLARFEISYTLVSPVQIQCAYKVATKMLVITPTYFDQYMELINQIRKIANQKITLINS